MIFKNHNIYDSFYAIYKDKHFPIKSFWLRRTHFKTTLNRKRVHRSTAERLVFIYNRYYDTDENIETLFDTKTLYLKEKRNISFSLLQEIDEESLNKAIQLVLFDIDELEG